MSKFKIRFDEESSEPTLEEEVKEVQVAKVNRRITTLAVLMPILMLVMLAFAYFEIKKGLVQT